jgi:carbonic anhydrase
MISAREALERLREGNRRFVSEQGSRSGLAGRGLLKSDAEYQSPFAIILGCSDSLFVIRVAGNIVAPSQIGSVEFAAERFGTRLVVVLGHSRCGAIDATLEALKQPQVPQSVNIRSIVDRIRPSVEALMATDLKSDSVALSLYAVRANIRVSASHLRHGSESLELLIEKHGLVVVGAEYSLDTGVVDFFDHVP